MVEARRPDDRSRLAFVDALKALAFQLIVLHHLAFYGPMSDHAYPLAPVLMTWLSQDARMAVQAFLVIAGFLAARSIAPNGALLSNEPFVLMQQRYLKLVTPFLAAVVIGIVCAAIARELMVHDSIPGPPTLPQILAHASRDTELRPGDVLGSGTVGTGCILELTPDAVGGWLKPGDQVTLWVECLGSLHNLVSGR